MKLKIITTTLIMILTSLSLFSQSSKKLEPRDHLSSNLTFEKQNLNFKIILFRTQSSNEEMVSEVGTISDIFDKYLIISNDTLFTDIPTSYKPAQDPENPKNDIMLRLGEKFVDKDEDIRFFYRKDLIGHKTMIIANITQKVSWPTIFLYF